MDSGNPSRREFIATSAGAFGSGWLALQLPLISALAACARDAAVRNDPFTTLTAAQARAMSAFAAQIVPTDAELPGATEAGAVYFVDRALASQFTGLRDPVIAGLADLDRRAATRGRDSAAARAGASAAASAPSGTSFADLASDDQIAIMRDVEATPFFSMARMLVIMGVVADPSYGGNRDGAAARILAMEHRPVFAPPFGYYDAELRGGAGAGA